MEHIKKKVKAIIFDMDGTIIDTENIWKNVTLDVLKEHGILVLSQEQEQFLTTLSGMGLLNAVIAVKNFFDLSSSIEEIKEKKLALAHKRLAGEIAFIEGFKEFHATLREHNIPTGIATNASESHLQQISKQLKFKDMFGSHIYSIAQVNHKAKPDPAIFLHVAEKLGVKPEECVVFEDSLPGFSAAKAAGMHCIAIKNSLNSGFLDTVHEAIENYHHAHDALRRLAKK